jgi:dTDP-4-dehydrorhamnose reductase
MSERKPRLLIIGSQGFLGGYAVEAAKSTFEVIECARNLLGDSGIPIDITDKHSVKAGFERAAPEFVLLLSAISDIDRCQQYPDEAKAVNWRGAEHVAEACARGNARLLLASSAAVFDGKRHGYSEEDPVNPLNVYGETKAMAEKSVLALVQAAIVVRFALVLGFAARPGTNALLNRLSARWRAGGTVALPIFEKRNPIDSRTAALLMTSLLTQPEISGIFHLGSADPVSLYDLGARLAVRMGYAGRVEPEDAPIGDRAPRGRDHYLLTEKVRRACSIQIPTSDEVIARCFDGIA